jgi:hypothetical protein
MSPPSSASTRLASRTNAARSGKWWIAFTQNTRSNEPSPHGMRSAAPGRTVAAGTRAVVRFRISPHGSTPHGAKP